MSKNLATPFSTEGDDVTDVISMKVENMGNFYLHSVILGTTVASLSLLFGSIFVAIPALSILLPALYLNQNFREFLGELELNGVVFNKNISLFGLCSLFVKAKLKRPMDVLIEGNEGKRLTRHRGELRLIETKHDKGNMELNSPIDAHKAALSSWKNVMASCNKTFELANLKQAHLATLQQAKDAKRKLVDVEYNEIKKYYSKLVGRSHDGKSMELMEQLKEITSKINSLSYRLNKNEEYFFLNDPYSSRYSWNQEEESRDYKDYKSGQERILDQQYSRMGEAIAVGNKLKELYRDPSLFKQDALGSIFDEV